MTSLPPLWGTFGLWISAALTVWLLSFAFKDNAFYKLAEHLFLGVAASYSFVLALDSIIKIGITPLEGGDSSTIVPFAFGALFFAKYFRRYGWISRFGPAFVAGIGLGIAVRTAPESFILKQISASMLPLWSPNPLTTVTNILMTLIVMGGLAYFTFCFVPGIRGTKRTAASRLYNVFSKIGIYGMMIGFATLFANTIVTRVAYLIGRLTDLIASPEASIVATILAVAAITYAYRREKKTALGKT